MVCFLILSRFWMMAGALPAAALALLSELVFELWERYLRRRRVRR
jgi:osmoprotectant transport system permease protein